MSIWTLYKVMRRPYDYTHWDWIHARTEEDAIAKCKELHGREIINNHMEYTIEAEEERED